MHDDPSAIWILLFSEKLFIPEELRRWTEGRVREEEEQVGKEPPPCLCADWGGGVSPGVNPGLNH